MQSLTRPRSCDRLSNPHLPLFTGSLLADITNGVAVPTALAVPSCQLLEPRPQAEGPDVAAFRGGDPRRDILLGA